jgi:putative peptidoglycan lipid II flippase
MVPRTVGLAVHQVHQLVILTIASFLPAGSLSVYYYANNLQAIPVSIIGVSVSMVAFTHLSEAVAARDGDAFRNHLSTSARNILFLVIPSSVLLLVFRAQVVRLVYGTGRFDWDATVATLDTVAFFALSLPAQALIPLLARAFYAHQNTRTPVVISIFSLCVSIIGGVLLAPIYGIAGVALAYSGALIGQVLCQLYFLRRSYGRLGTRAIMRTSFSCGLLALLAGGVGYGLLHVADDFTDTRTFVGLLIQGGVAGMGAVGVYFLGALAFKLPELQGVFRRLRRRDANT